MIVQQPSREWIHQIPQDEWNAYRPVVEALIARGPTMALGGGFAYSYHTHTWRNTKDIDLYVKPEDRAAAIDLVNANGFEDYHDRVPYDRSWIYRGFKEDLIVDIIWEMANHRAPVDDGWLKRGPQTTIHDLTVRVLPIEELIFAKLYVMQRDRCDWPDLLNLLYTRGSSIDWTYMKERLGEDVQLLQAVLHVFSWMCPERASGLPNLLDENPPADRLTGKPKCDAGRRVRLLDSREWFVGLANGPSVPAIKV